MGCVSSKLAAEEIKKEREVYSHHVVSLTSSTYGVLELEKEGEFRPEVEVKKQRTKEVIVQVKRSSFSPPSEEPSEIINAWELMEDLEEGAPVVVQSKRSPKSKIFYGKSPLKLMNQMGKLKITGSKENKGRVVHCVMRSLENSPKTVLKECGNLGENGKKPSPNARLWASGCDSLSRRRKSLGPLLDPEVGKEEHVLESYKKKCPPGGENAVIIYTTTLRGIRKTFEECNVARSIIESQSVQMFERDISMHSAFKEELRAVMRSKVVRVPVVFVKGRLIGGADEMVKLDEEGKLGLLFSGIPRAASGGCAGCGGIRFIMCLECSGSCKVLGEDGKKSVKCNKCNENGLIQCPFCCCLTI